MNIPIDWKKVEVKNVFAIWLPPTLREEYVSAVDSSVRRWANENIIVHFDLGRFSDPLTLYSQKRAFEMSSEQIDGVTATLVSFHQDNGWYLTAVHFPDLGKDRFGQTVKLTLVVEAKAIVDKQVPLRIVRSVQFL